MDKFKELEERNIKGKIITSTYLNFTDPKALERIKKFSNIDLKIFESNRDIGFHTKAYIFENKNDYKIIIGSSNITQSALKSNVEWNVKIISKKDNIFVQNVLKKYKTLLNSSSIVDKEFLNNYKKFIDEINKIKNFSKINLMNNKEIKQNSMQEMAVTNLEKLREYGESKALVIASTGTGKTYMSAFDVKKFNPKRILFIVHREEILSKAKETYERIIKNKSMGLYTGNLKEKDADYLFSTVQSLNLHLFEFKEDDFDYIIVDEAHHSASSSYQKILEYFKPKFLLGMTATPERSDGENIFEIFDNNVALEVRLYDALKDELVIPFHYFGITDITGIDLSDVDIDNISEVTKRLNINKRVNFIINKMNFYGHDGDKLKCIGFCVSIEHAKYMAEEFNKRGIKSICLTGNDSVERRKEVIKRFEDNEDELKVIFTVDIFNEGVDIPSINMVLMLRPTNSPIIFIQQLGRGLRKHDSKSFLTVLDFIGNHNKVFLVAIALKGERYYDKDSLRVEVATGFKALPGCTNIQMDRISKERILAQIEKENFNSLKYLKDEYFEFKKMNQGKVPYLLLDYIKFDGAPDPIKFISYSKTYVDFLVKVEKDNKLKSILEDDNFSKVLKELSSNLSLKRVYEFAIIKYLLNHYSISFEKARKEVLKYVEKVDDDSIKHTLECLNGNYLDSLQKKSCIRLFEYKNDILTITDDFENLIQNKIFKKYIEDVINYGIIRYEKEFGRGYYGVPFFKLYEQYKMIDTALLSNYRKVHSSFRGSGLITNNKEYFLFVDLHKDEDIKESIKYQDKFISRKIFQWQTPNSTSQESDRGKNIIFNKERKINLHLFIRKFKKIDGEVQPYIYTGKGNTIKFEGEKPITVLLELEKEIPFDLYNELNQIIVF